MKEELEFYDDAEWDYEDSSWEAYRQIKRAQKRKTHGNREDIGVFLPSPDDQRLRIAQIRWLYSLGFTNSWICSIMQYECPDIELVRRFIRKYGADETRRRLNDLREKTEYDNGRH